MCFRPDRILLNEGFFPLLPHPAPPPRLREGADIKGRWLNGEPLLIRHHQGSSGSTSASFFLGNWTGLFFESAGSGGCKVMLRLPLRDRLISKPSSSAVSSREDADSRSPSSSRSSSRSSSVSSSPPAGSGPSSSTPASFRFRKCPPLRKPLFGFRPLNSTGSRSDPVRTLLLHRRLLA